MATQAYDLLVRIEASTEALRRELATGERSVSNFSKNVNQQLSGLDRSIASFGSSFRAALGTLGIGVGIGAITNLASQALDLAENLTNVSRQAGVTADFLQTMREAARQTGIEANAMDNALGNLTATIGKATSGNKQAIEKFKALNVEFVDASGNARTTESGPA